MQIILCIAAAMICGLLLTRVVKPVHLPNVTGYLIAGLIIGPYCLGIFQESDAAVTDVLTDVALGFIAFSIGGEFRISNIKQVGTSSITITFFQACLATLLVDAALLACGFPAPLSLTLGAIAAATAPAATLMVVRQYHAKGEVTSTLLPVVAMDDAVGLMLFSISLPISQALASNAALTVTSMLLQPLLEIVLSLAVGAGIGLLIALAMRFFHSKIEQDQRSGRHSAARFRTCFYLEPVLSAALYGHQLRSLSICAMTRMSCLKSRMRGHRRCLCCSLYFREPSWILHLFLLSGFWALSIW